MSTSNGKITAPVTIGDIAQTIGVASNELGQLCTSGKINKWSKYKPEQYMSFNDLTDAQHKNAVNLVGAIVPYGLFKKPAATGSYYCTGATVNSVESLTNQSDIETVKEGMKWNYEGRVRIDYENQTGELNGKPVYATQGGFPCRKADFDGYDHYSRNPIEIQWVKIKESDEGLGGLFAKITYNDTDVAEDYGGVTRADLGLGGYKLVLIGQSVDNQAVVETGDINHPRYVIAGHSTTVIDGKTALGYIDRKLAPLMGDVNFFFVLVNKDIAWDIYAESMNGGIYVNPEGWKDGDTYYYPKMKTLPDIAYFVEGSAYRVSFPDGLGTVIWGAEEYHNNIYGGDYTKLYANVEVYNYNTVTFGFPYATFTAGQGNMGFTLKTNISLLDDVRRAYRRLKFAKVEEQTEYLTDNYLNKCGHGAAVFYSGLKPLVRNMITSSGNYADLYLRFDSDVSGCIVYRIKDVNGNILRTVDIYTGWGELIHSFPRLYEEVILENIVSARNQVVGFALRIKMKAGSDSAYYVTYESTGTRTINGASYEDTTFEEYPILGALEETGKYWDIEVLLPNDVLEDMSPYGGDAMITYDVNKTI